MKMYSMEIGQIQGMVNDGVNLVLQAMQDDGVIPDSVNIATDYVIVASENSGWFGNLFKRHSKPQGEKDSIFLTVIHIWRKKEPQP